MNSGTPRTLRAPALVALALVAAASVHADTTIAFQNGVSGYSGAKDTSINTQYAESNGGNGVRWSGDPELGCYTVSGSGGYTVRYLLKFGGLTVPAGPERASRESDRCVEDIRRGAARPRRHLGGADGPLGGVQSHQIRAGCTDQRRYLNQRRVIADLAKVGPRIVQRLLRVARPSIAD